MKLLEYVENFPMGRYSSLLASDIVNRMRKLLSAIGGVAVGQCILESEISRSGAGGDFSIQITRSGLAPSLAMLDGEVFQGWCVKSGVWARISELFRRWENDSLFEKIGDVWLEFDYDALGLEIPVPCIFVGANNISVEDALKGPLSVILGDTPTSVASALLSKCADELSEIGLFQLGVMLGRYESPRRIRLFTDSLRGEQVIPFLRRVGWGKSNEYTKIEEFICWARSYSNGFYVIDFGLSDEGITDRLGICFAPPPGIQPLSIFLDALEKRGWALPEKCEDIKQWVERNDIIHLINNISHFKFPFDGEILGAKVYLLHEPSHILLLPPNCLW